MVDYLVMRLEMGALNYKQVIKKYPKYKTDIDTRLAEDGYIVLPDGNVIKSPEA